ncbi:substrate-binding domain-containing protein, partial [Acinetobacter baumannii]
EAIAAAIHFHTDNEVNGSGEDANVAAVRTLSGLHDAALIGFVRREQGLLLQPGNPKGLNGLADVLARGATMALRQPGAGAQ